MSRYKDGDYIYLVWEDVGTPDAFFIKGHVSHKDGIEKLIGECAIDSEDEVGEANHCYARWSMEPREDGNGHILKTYKSTGRGRFRVTEFGVGIFAKTKETEK